MLPKAGSKKGGPLAKPSVAAVHRLLNAALEHAVIEKWLSRNPLKGLHSSKRPAPPTRVKPFEFAVLDHMLAHTRVSGETPCPYPGCVDGRPASQRDRHHQAFPLIVLVGRCGLRRGEACGLWWADIDFDRRFLTVQRALDQPRPIKGRRLEPGYKAPKSEDGVRKLPLSADVVEALRFVQREQASSPQGLQQTVCTTRHLAYEKSPDGRFNQTRDPERAKVGLMLPQTATGLIRDLVDSMGVGGHLYRLRHTAGFVWRQSGLGLDDVKRFMGHSELSTTVRHYGGTTDEAALAAIDRSFAWLQQRTASGVVPLRERDAS